MRRKEQWAKAKAFLAESRLYIAGSVGAFLSRYIDDYTQGVDVQFKVSWEILIMSVVFGFFAALLADLGGSGTVAKRKHWKRRVVTSLALGFAIDIAIARFVELVLPVLAR
jgi:hypothetical protein